MDVASLDDLYRLKRLSGLDEVVVRTRGFKFRGALRHALKYALWAVAPGGRIVVCDTGPRSYRVDPYTVPFHLVRQQVFKTLGRDTELVALDEHAMRIVLKRISAPLADGWSAGLLFSGNEAELPLLRRAIAGLKDQPELGRDRGGQIIVCGPASAERLIAPLGDIEYLPFAEVGPRALITRKKNAIVRRADNPRVVLLHARIVLEKNCLASLPREFDAITPRVAYREGGRAFRYLDFHVEQALDGEGLAKRLSPLNSYDRDRHLDILAKGRPYIDGALIAVRRSIALQVPFHEQLAWGEAEDLEWSARLQASGYLVDLAPEALAVSQTLKLPREMVTRPLLFALGRRASRFWRLLKGAFLHRFRIAFHGG